MMLCRLLQMSKPITRVARVIASVPALVLVSALRLDVGGGCSAGRSGVGVGAGAGGGDALLPLVEVLVLILFGWRWAA